MFENLASKGPGMLLSGDLRYARTYCVMTTIAPRPMTFASSPAYAILALGPTVRFKGGIRSMEYTKGLRCDWELRLDSRRLHELTASDNQCRSASFHRNMSSSARRRIIVGTLTKPSQLICCPLQAAITIAIMLAMIGYALLGLNRSRYRPRNTVTVLNPTTPQTLAMHLCRSVALS